MKDNNKTVHWVGCFKLKPLDTAGDFQQKKVIDDIQASLSGTKIEHYDYGREQNPYLLQEAEEQKYEEANDDAYVTAEAIKIDEDENGMIISMKEEQNTLEY